MNKKVTFGARPEREASMTVAADAWVNSQATAATIEAPQPKEKEATKRLTLDVSADLHRRIKVQCAVQGVNIADALRELLEQRFPEQ
jgi:hypothetical protein